MFWYTIPMHKRQALIIAKKSEDRQLVVDLLEACQVDTIVTDNLTRAQQALKQGGITQVVTGSLQGKWRQMVKLTRRYAGTIPITLWTARLSYQPPASQMGVGFVDRESFDWMALVEGSVSEGDYMPPQQPSKKKYR